MTTRITLKRTGKAPLEFQGKCLVTIDGERALSPTTRRGHFQRWHVLSVYRTADDRWVARISLFTTHDDEYDHHEAEVFDSPQQAQAFFENHNPTYYVRGFPPSTAYAERQRQLLQDIAARYRNLVTELMEKTGFVERV